MAGSRIVRIIFHKLVVPLDPRFFARDIERDERVGIKVFARSTLADEIGTRIPGATNKVSVSWSIANPLHTAPPPCFQESPGQVSCPELPGAWNGLPIPQAFAVIDAEGANQTNIAVVAASRTQDDLVLVDICSH